MRGVSTFPSFYHLVTKEGENSNQVKFPHLQPGTHLEWKYCVQNYYSETGMSQSVCLLRGPEITEVHHGLFSPSTTWSPLSYYLTLRLPLSIVILIVLFFIFLLLVLLFPRTNFIIMMLQFVFLGKMLSLKENTTDYTLHIQLMD